MDGTCDTIDGCGVSKLTEDEEVVSLSPSEELDEVEGGSQSSTSDSESESES